MLAGRDSAVPPTDAQLAEFYAAGVRVYGGYIKLGNDGIYRGWAKADFDRVRAHGMTPLAYMSGWDDPAEAKSFAASWSVLGVLDVEGGIRGDGPWVPSWLAASGFGLYGNGGVHAGRSAAFHVLAGYPSFRTTPVTWFTAYAPRPAGPCGWQYEGTHAEYGEGVDSSWFDDWFAPGVFGAQARQVTSGFRHPASEDSNIAILFHPTQVDRMDVLVIGTDQAVYHFWGTTDALTKGTSGVEGWGGSFVPGTLSAAWYNDPANVRLVCQAVDASGVAHIREVDTSGAVVREWAPLLNGTSPLKAALPTAGAVGPKGDTGAQGPQGPKGDTGPAGPVPSSATIAGPITVKLT